MPYAQSNREGGPAVVCGSHIWMKRSRWPLQMWWEAWLGREDLAAQVWPAEESTGCSLAGSGAQHGCGSGTDGRMSRQEDTSHPQPTRSLAQSNSVYKRRSMPRQGKNKELLV